MGVDQRSPERLRHHYEVEKELGDQMRRSTREQRTELFSKLYDELFERVPDHPRLVRRETPEESRRGVDARLAILRDHIGPDTTFLEFAPGDCRLAHEVCGRVKKVLGVDISDQRAEADVAPENFELVIYDGYHLEVEPGSVDVAFSYQFLEHLHPEDVPLHMEMAFRALKPGGCYIFDTPHAYSGPHDISRHFSPTPQGFHLKEWTYREMFATLRAAGFTRCYTFRGRRARMSQWFNFLTLGLERAVGLLPRKFSKAIRTRLFLGVTMIAIR